MASFTMRSMLSVFLVAALLTPGCRKKETENVIKVGEIGSMTGAEATFGLSTHEGVKLAMDEANAAGGINGKKIEVISIDDQGKPEEAAIAMTKLITQNKVVAVIGEVASSRSLAIAPIAQQYKVPMISPSSTNPKVTQIGNYIFRVCFIDPFQGTVMARFALDTLKVKKLAIFRDVKNDYSVGLADFFKETLLAGGGQVVADQSYSAGDMDFKSQLTAIRTAEPEAVFIPGYYTDVGLIVRQARELGLTVPLLGGDGWDSPKLTEIGGAAMDGTYFSNHYSEEDKSPQVVSFIEKYKKAYGIVPNGISALGYDAAMVLIDALKRTKSSSQEDLRNAIAETKNFVGIGGKITMDENRNPVKPAVVIKVQDGKFRYTATVEPK